MSDDEGGAVMGPWRGLKHGFQTYLRGVAWLRAHPRYMALLVFPWMIGIAAFMGGMALFIHYDQSLLGLVSFGHPDGPWWHMTLHYLLEVVLYLTMALATLLVSLLLMSIVAAPIYEVVSEAVEHDLMGRKSPSLGLWGNLRSILVELKKVAVISLLSLLLLLVPGLNLLAALGAAFLLGWDFFDYPLARRGLSLSARFRLVLSNFWVVLGFGVWLVIPGLQVLTVPMAVAGGTILGLEALREPNGRPPRDPRRLDRPDVGV